MNTKPIASSEINLAAKRTWLHSASNSKDILAGVVVHGDVLWFKVKIGSIKSQCFGPFFDGKPDKARPARRGEIDEAEKALRAYVQESPILWAR